MTGWRTILYDIILTTYPPHTDFDIQFDSAVKLLTKSRTESTQKLTSINNNLVAATRDRQAKDNIEELRLKIETAEQKLADEESTQVGMTDELAALARAVQDCKEKIEQHKMSEEKKLKHIRSSKHRRSKLKRQSTLGVRVQSMLRSWKLGRRG